MRDTNFKIQCVMDYEKILDNTGNKYFWNKFSGLKANLISALENAEAEEKQCNLPVVNNRFSMLFQNVDTNKKCIIHADSEKAGFKKAYRILKEHGDVEIRLIYKQENDC